MKAPHPSKRFRPPARNRVLIDGTLDGIDRLQASVGEKGRNASPYVLHWQHKEAIRELIPCHNPQCFDGGLSFGDLLRELARDRQENYIGTAFCTGREGDPEMPGPHPSCQTRYEIEISLRFRQPK
jgi:hypothetical protein